MPDHRIAVIGMAARLPGGGTAEDFWARTLAGTPEVRRFDREELRAAGVPDAEAEHPDFVGASAILGDVSRFDAGFFGISPREAAATDPQHRLFLEVVHHALEDAGRARPDAATGRRVGVYGGAGYHLYAMRGYLRRNLPGEVAGADEPGALRLAFGTSPDFLASRAAFRLGLTGPAVSVQTGCSTGLVALHTAAQALLAGDADLAVAGASALHVPQVLGYRYVKGSILSPSGVCRAFDADSDGTVGGNGVLAMVLKRYDDAVADGDRIHAVILGVGVTNDGDRKRAYAAPSAAGQTAAVRTALDRAGVSARDVGYVETHGTGTLKGDPIEFDGLVEAFRADTDAVGYCALGSAKPAIGHLDAAAGLAGLLRAVFAVRDGRIPPMVNHRTPNPGIDLERGPFYIPTASTPWPADTPRIAGVSSLGVGGTNVHVIVAAPPAPEPVADPPADGPAALPLSAAHPDALRELAGAYADLLTSPDAPAVSAVAAAAVHGRRTHAHRLAATGDRAAIASALASYAATGSAGELAAGTAGDPAPVLAYTGQGSAYAGMARALYHAHPGFREVLDAADEAYTEVTGASLAGVLLGEDPGCTPITDTALAQPALFAHQAAMTRLWADLGLRPAAVTGHSVGEFAALYAAGALGLTDGMRVTAERGRLMREGTPPAGMLSLHADAAAAEAVAAACPGVVVAVANTPELHVLAGRDADLAAAAAVAGERGIRHRRLHVDRAFHSPLLDPILDRYARLVAGVELRPTTVPFISGVDGAERAPGWTPDPEYFVAQARRPVRFDLVVPALAEPPGAWLLELGPHPALTALAAMTHPRLPAVAAGRRGDEAAALLRAVGEAYCAGVPVDWTVLTPPPRRHVPLPPYPYRRDRHWIEPPAAAEPPTPVPASGDNAMPTATTGPDPAVLALIRDSAARQLGCLPEDIDPNVPFSAYGADSLLLLTMIRELERAYGVRVSMRELFEEAETAGRLAVLVESRRPRPTPAEGTPPAAEVPATPAAGTAPTAPAAGPAPAAVPAAVPAPAPPPPTVAATPAEEASSGGAFEALVRAAEASAHAAAAAARSVERLTLGAGAVPAAAPAAHTGAAPAEVPAIPAEETAITPEAEPVPVSPATVGAGGAAPVTSPEFGLYFFGDYPDAAADEGASTASYATLLEAARFADAHRFSSVWLPERHFDSFGGIFPNPSVLAAAIAAGTEHVRINSGSVVLPLHDTIRVAEEWSMVDGLSGGRVGLGIASGWHPDDFVLHPDRFERRAEIMYEQLADLRSFWSGKPLVRRGGSGKDVSVSLHPRPVQAEPRMYTAVVGRRESYAAAARNGLGIVTNLMTQTPEQLAENIAYYREVRAESGLDPAAGHVAVLMHTYLGEDLATARAEAFEPFRRYMRASLRLFGQMAASLGVGADMDGLGAEDLDYLFRRAYDRYCASRALIGSPRSVRHIVDAVVAAGADEIAALVDFGVPAHALRRGLPHLAELRESYAAGGPAAKRRAGREAGSAEAAPAAVPGPAPAAERPSPGQERIWLAEQIQPEECAYNEPRAIRLTGQVDAARLRSALDALVERHPALRTVFRTEGDRPVRVARTGVRADFAIVEHPGADEETTVRAAIAAESDRRFDLAAGPLFVTRLLRFAPEHHVLVFSFHHIIVDALSAVILTRDLSALYRGEPLPPPAGARPEPDRERVAADVAYWTDRLSGDLPVLDLPTDRPRPPMLSAAGDAHTSRIGAETVERLGALAGDGSATLFMTLLAGLAATLRELGGRDELVIGVPIAQRPEGTENEIGFLVNTLALRLDLGGDPTAAELLAHVRERTLEAYDHADAPFEDVLRSLRVDRDTSRNPVFQVMAEYKNAEVFTMDLPGVTAEPLEIWRRRSMVDLAWHFTRGPAGIGCHLEYAADLFDHTGAERIADRLAATLTAFAADPNAPISAARAVAPDVAPAAARATGAAVAPTASRIEQIVADHARLTPDAPAIVHRGTTVSYADLDADADRLARRLSARGAGPGEVVALWLPRGPRLIGAMLAVLKTGAAYLPLDPALGDTRLAYILGDSRARLVLTEDGLAGRLPEGSPIVSLDAADTAGDPPGAAVDGDPLAPAYVVYTSGSTGEPKGVVVGHRSLLNLCRWHHRRFGVTPADVGAAVCGQSFDASVFEIWPVLTAGAALAIADEDVRRSTADLARWYAEHECTVSLLPTALGEELFTLPPERQPPLRTLVVGGDALRRRPPRGLPYEVVNAYGPTEATVLITVHTVDPDATGPIPIGSAVDNTALEVRGPNGAPVAEGEYGELFAAGDQLALGYLHAPGLTAERFTTAADGRRWYGTGDVVRWNADGELEFRGRADDQVKIRGYRVEPGEVTAALKALPYLADAAVLAVRDDGGEARLTAHLAGRADAGDVVAKARADLAASLPAYLQPAEWTAHEALPYDANGKLDRAALTAAPAAPAGAPVRADDVVERLTALWAGLLGVRVPDPETSFFRLGGHSLTALRLLNAVREEFGTDFPAAEFYRNPTLRAMAGRLTGAVPVAEEAADAVTGGTVQAPPAAAPGSRATGDTSTDGTATGAGTAPAAAAIGASVFDGEVVRSGPLSLGLHQWMSGLDGPDAENNILFELDLSGDLDVDALRTAAGDLEERHEILRSRFVPGEDGEIVEEVLRPAAVDVPVLDLRDLPEDEREAAAETEGLRLTSIPCSPRDGRMWRMELLRLGDGEWRLLLLVHHAITDGWSTGMMFGDLTELYTARVEGRGSTLAPATQPIDHALRKAASHDADEERRRLAYWQDRLRHTPTGVPLPYDHAKSEVAALTGRVIETFLTDADVTAARAVAERQGTTMFMVAATALGVYLRELTGQGHLLVAAAYANRDEAADESLSAPLALQSLLELRIDPAASFAELVGEHHASYFTDLAHWVYSKKILGALAEVRPAEEIVPPPWDVFFTYQSSLGGALHMPGLEVRSRMAPISGPSPYANFYCVPGDDGFLVGLSYTHEYLEPEHGDAWLAGYVATLRRLLAAPDAAVEGETDGTAVEGETGSTGTGSTGPGSTGPAADAGE